jgi:sulfofructose kinase
VLPFRIPPARTRAYDVVGLGLNSIDLVTVLDEYPVRDTKQRLKRFAKLPGGQIATALSVCARLGWTTRYLGSFGDDDLGRLSRESLIAEGVEVSGARVISGATNQFAVVLVDARSGARTVLWDRHPDLRIDPRTVSQEIVASGRLLIVDCEETAAATQAARYARDAGMITIIDVERMRPGIDGLLQQIDAIIASETFPTEFTGYAEQGRAIEAIAREFNAPLVCVTLGPDGSLAWCAGREFRTPGFEVECVDSTGAGDAFRGGFAAGCLRMSEGDIEDVLTYATAVAAHTGRALGARGGIPTAGEVEQLLYARS